MLDVGLVTVIIFCAALAVRARQLLASVLWMACTSAVLAMLLYEIGAYQIAVIELSVGAGLVTILIIFVLQLVGETGVGDYSPSFKLFGFGTVFLVVATLAILILPGTTGAQMQPPASQFSFSMVAWQQRSLDTMLQLVLIFSGALGILSLVTDRTGTKQIPTAKQLTPVNGSQLAAVEFQGERTERAASTEGVVVQQEERVQDGPITD